MGGVGSGSWYRIDKKTTTDECLGLDIRYLHRKSFLNLDHRFTLRWSRAGKEISAVRGVAYPDQIVLLYRYYSGPDADWEGVEEHIKVTHTPCNFGGERPWLVCPGVVNGVACGRRVAILYGPGRYFLCRHCYDLSYQSQREDKGYSALLRAQKIRERLGGSSSMWELFPERPKGMHHKTYDQLFWEHEEAEMKVFASMCERFDKRKRYAD